MKNILFLSVLIASLTLSACASPAAVSTIQPSVTQTAVPAIPTATSPAPTFVSTVTAAPPTPTLATVASSSANCTGLRTQFGGGLTSITFVNWSGRPVNVYFVDPEGLEQFYFELQPDQSVQQVTYVSHAWCARDKSSNASLLAAIATKDAQVATILGDIHWQETISLPMPSSAPFDSFRGQPLIFHNNRVYLFGGRSATNERLTNVVFSAIQQDGTLAEWKETTPLPGQYYDHATVRVGNYVYLLTGAAGSEDVYVASFNPDGTLGAWQETAALSAFSPSRQTFAAASYGNFIYATGGNSGGTKNFVQYTSVHADGSLAPWSLTRSLPRPVQEHTMIAYDGYLYVLGGRGSNDAWVDTVYFSAIRSDGTLEDWQTTTSLPQVLHGSATFESNGYIYLLGGSSIYYARILENHGLDEWQRTTPLPALRNASRVGAHNGYAYVIGGADFAEPQRTVYYAGLGGIAEPLDCTAGWTRLRSGMYAKISEDTSEPNRVREAPDTTAKIIYQIYPGGIVHVVEGPVCTNGLVFWKVANTLIPGGTGWTAEGNGKEYFLEPIQ
jgi:hypothetical protein